MPAGDFYFATGALRYRDSGDVQRTLLAFASNKVRGFTAPAIGNYATGTILLYQGQFDRGSGWENGIILLFHPGGTVWRYYAFVGPLFADTNHPNVAGTGVLYVSATNLRLQYGGQAYTGVT